MRTYVQIFSNAVLAGIAIGIGGVVYLGMDHKIAGALLFTIGLYGIVLNRLDLYTGKIGYAVNRSPVYLIEMGVTWCGNLCGTVLVGTVISFTRLKTAEAAMKLCAVKLEDTWLSVLILSVFCGILMYIAVDGYKSVKNPVILFLGVSVFILAGFEHCVANMFYFTMAGVWSVKAVGYILLMTLGNSLGGMLIPLVGRLNSTVPVQASGMAQTDGGMAQADGGVVRADSRPAHSSQSPV